MARHGGIVMSRLRVVMCRSHTALDDLVSLSYFQASHGTRVSLLFPGAFLLYIYAQTFLKLFLDFIRIVLIFCLSLCIDKK